MFFDVAIEKALMRTHSRDTNGEKKNRMDLETSEFYSRVRDAYLRIAAKEKKRFKVIDGNISVAEVHTQVLETVNKFLGQIG